MTFKPADLSLLSSRSALKIWLPGILFLLLVLLFISYGLPHLLVSNECNFPEKIVVKNEKKHAIKCYIRSPNQRLFRTNQDLIEHITGEQQLNDEQKALHLFRYVSERFNQKRPFDEGNDLHNPIKFFNVYGYGFCDDAAEVFVNLCQQVGLKGRVIGLNGHVVAEVKYNESWHYFDPTWSAFVRNNKGEIASRAEILSSEVLADELYPSNRKYKKLLMDTVGDNAWSNYDEVEGNFLHRPFLLPANSFVELTITRSFFNDIYVNKKHWKYLYKGKGRLVMNPDIETNLKQLIQTGYRIVSVHLKAEGCPSVDQIQLVSGDRQYQFKKNAFWSKNYSVTFGDEAIYRCNVLFDEQHKDCNIQLKADFIFSPYSIWQNGDSTVIALDASGKEMDQSGLVTRVYQ